MQTKATAHTEQTCAAAVCHHHLVPAPAVSCLSRSMLAACCCACCAGVCSGSVQAGQMLGCSQDARGAPAGASQTGSSTVVALHQCGCVPSASTFVVAQAAACPCLQWVSASAGYYCCCTNVATSYFPTDSASASLSFLSSHKMMLADGCPFYASDAAVVLLLCWDIRRTPTTTWLRR